MEAIINMPIMPKIIALLNHIKVGKRVEKHEIAVDLCAPHMDSINDGLIEMMPYIFHSRTERHETAIMHHNHYTTWGSNGNAWSDYITTTFKTQRILCRYVYKINPSSFNMHSESGLDYEQLMANGSNPKILVDQSHFKSANDGAAMLELKRRQETRYNAR